MHAFTHARTSTQAHTYACTFSVMYTHSQGSTQRHVHTQTNTHLVLHTHITHLALHGPVDPQSVTWQPYRPKCEQRTHLQGCLTPETPFIPWANFHSILAYRSTAQRQAGALGGAQGLSVKSSGHNSFLMSLWNALWRQTNEGQALFRDS